VPEKVKVNADIYVNDPCPKLRMTLKAYCQATTSMQGDSPIYSSHFVQYWIEQNSTEFVMKYEPWPSNSSDLNSFNYYVCGAMLERYKVFTPKPTSKAEPKTLLETICKDFSQEAIDLAVQAFRKRL